MFYLPRLKIGFFFFFFLWGLSGTDAADYPFALIAKGSYTTSARFSYGITQSALSLQNRYFSYNFGFGGEFRWNVPNSRWRMSVCAEKIVVNISDEIPVRSSSGPVYVASQEGYSIVPVELTGAYILPFSTDDISIALGGGGGYYSGMRLYRIAGIDAETVRNDGDFGIHAAADCEWRIFSRLVVNFEMKFRDPQIDSEEQFNRTNVAVNGAVVQLPGVSTTRINLNGITYSFGAGWRF